MRERPVRFSDSTGLRLCGIAEEPFCPSEKNSSASSTSVRCMWRISTAMRSTEEAISPRTEKIHRVAVARDHLRRDRLGHEAHGFCDMRFDARIDLRKGADGAGDGAGRDFLARRDQAPLGAPGYRECGHVKSSFQERTRINTWYVRWEGHDGKG